MIGTGDQVCDGPGSEVHLTAVEVLVDIVERADELCEQGQIRSASRQYAEEVVCAYLRDGSLPRGIGRRELRKALEEARHRLAFKILIKRKRIGDQMVYTRRGGYCVVVGRGEKPSM